MAGGSGFNVRESKNDPKEIFNWRLWLILLSMAWSGCFYGFDSGNIGGILTLPSFKNDMGLNGDPAVAANRKGTLAAMLPAGATVGAFLAAPTSDYMGRKWSIFLWGIVFLIGAAIQMIANYDVILAGRFIGGLGVGATSMLTPQFLAENSPKSIRGAMTSTYNLMIVTSLMLAFWVNYAVSRWTGDQKHNSTQWRVAMSIQIAPALIMCCMIPFVNESPRFLINHNKLERGLETLCKLRKLPPTHKYVQTEYQEMVDQHNYEQEISQGHSYWVVAKDVVQNRSNLRRFFLALMLFLFHKLTGTDSLNYFAPDIFRLIGIRGTSTPLMTTGVYGAVKVATMIFYIGYLVDRVGRRLPLIVGATIQATCMLYLGLYLRFAHIDENGGTPAGGYVGVFAIYLYAFGWSFGHSVACYVFAAEAFPTRIRSFCMSCCFIVNWVVNYGLTRATPNMIRTMNWGVFLLYALLTYIGAIFVFFCFPELKGRSIESMDDLFARPLWTMWKHAYPTEEEKTRRGVQQFVDEKIVDADNLSWERGEEDAAEKARAVAHVEERKN